MKHLDHLLTQVAEPNNYKLKERAIYFSANFGKGWQAFFNFARHKLKYCCIESHLRTYRTSLYAGIFLTARNYILT